MKTSHFNLLRCGFSFASHSFNELCELKGLFFIRLPSPASLYSNLVQHQSFSLDAGSEPQLQPRFTQPCTHRPWCAGLFALLPNPALRIFVSNSIIKRPFFGCKLPAFLSAPVPSGVLVSLKFAFPPTALSPVRALPAIHNANGTLSTTRAPASPSLAAPILSLFGSGIHPPLYL